MRLFLALELNPEIRNSLAALEQQVSAAAVRWAKVEQIHLTSKFLGDVTDERAVEIEQGMNSIVAGLAPFEFTVAGGGCFPERGAVRIVWAGVQQPCAELATLTARIEEQLEELGFEREGRPFHPHITLARVKFDNSYGKLREEIAALKFKPATQRVTCLTLFQSILGAGGSAYKALHRAEFKD